MIEEHSLDMNTQVDNEFSVSSSENTKTVACNNKSNAPQTDSLLKLDVTNLEPKNGSDKKQDDTVCQMKLDSVKHNFEDSKSNLAETKQSEPVCSSCFANMAEESKSETDIEKSQPNSLQYRNNHDYEISDPDESDKNDIDQHVSSTHNIPPMIEIICLSRSESPTSGSNCQKHDKDSSSPWLTKNSDGAKENLSTAPIKSPEVVRTNATIRRLRLENEKLQAEVTRLRRLVVSGALSLLNEKRLATDAKIDSPDKLQALQIELQLTKEALITLKSDRKRLKAEKFDLLNQMKQLYITLEDKEKELRDFIRNYEQSMRENDTSLQQLSTEREERERERWSLLRHARDEAEQSLSLAAQLNAKELQLQHAQEQLQDARRQLASSGCLSDHESVASMSRQNLSGGAVTPNSGIFPASAHGIGLLPGDRGSCSADSGVRVSSDRESAATSIGDNLSDCTTDVAFTKDSSPTQSPSIASPFARTTGSNILSRSVEQLNSPLDEPVNLGHRSKNSRPTGGRGGTWGSISRVFARSRNRSKSNLVQGDGNLETFRNWSPLTEEGYAEKLRLLREASSVPMERWRAPTVVAWLEVALGMPQYGTRCSENIKSGKVLLELSDFELECGLGITHPMHRKKLRLAIEEHRHPELIRYSCIAQLGHTWVSSEWLLHLGLSQYTETFAANLVDARILEHLSKKELEKYLGVTRKFHQASIVHGIHLLRIMKYDRQALAVRRHQCENMDADPLVWTNQRFIRWARNIDLGEYADNLKDSGVHGGLVVLEPSFNSDTMGTALGIPSSKNIIRKHLTAELDALILPARYVIFCQMEEYQMEATHVMYHKTSKTKNNNY